MLLAVAVATPHEFDITSVALVFLGDGSYRADISLDADALALGLPLETDAEVVAATMAELSDAGVENAVAMARPVIQREIDLSFDGTPANFDVAFPHYGTAAASDADPPTALGTIARLSGRVPPGARELTFTAAARYKTIDLRILGASAPEPLQILLQPGETSPPYQLAGGEQTALTEGVFWRYTLLGYEHILPKGLDHILFVLGLFLLSTRLRPLLYQITAFTLAHSVTLALSMFEVISLPSSIVEPLIAASIVYVAIENVATTELKPWRVAVVFLFGLLHGLGFAGVLQELGLPEGRFVTALVAFNVGVELGQLSVVALAVLAVGRFRALPGYRKWVVVPCSVAIAAVGLWWAVERSLGLT